MNGKTMIFNPRSTDPEVTIFEASTPGLEFLQRAVGGYIQHVPDFDWFEDGPGSGKWVPCVVYCDEEGKFKDGAEVNFLGVMLWDKSIRRAGVATGLLDPVTNSWPRNRRHPMAPLPREMCRRNATKQCAPICLSHPSSTPLGECPSVCEVWTDEAIARDGCTHPLHRPRLGGTHEAETAVAPVARAQRAQGQEANGPAPGDQRA
jgi:hypothetical protein